MSTAGNIGGGVGAGIGAAFGNPAIGQKIGQAAGEMAQPLLQEFSPAAVAQRKEFKKAREQLRAGNFGYTEAQKQQEGMSGAQQIAAQQAQVQADIARQQAAGTLSGGGATDARRALYQQALAANAQNAANVQAASNAKAQYDYEAAQGRVDAQAGLARKFWKDDAEKENIDWTANFASVEDPTKGDLLFGRKAGAAKTPAPEATT